MLERDPDKSASLRSAHPDTIVVTGDATSPDDNAAAVAATLDAHGGLDVLVNCVGIFDFYRGIRDLGRDELLAAFDELFRVNVASQLLGVQAALGPLTESHGCIVLTCSTSGFYPGRGGVLYVASKFAVRGLVVALAHELAPDVRVNGVAPGGTMGTDLRGPTALGLDRRVTRRTSRPRGRAPRPHTVAGRPHPRRSRRELRVPRLRPLTWDHRHVPPPRRRDRRQGLTARRPGRGRPAA